MNPEEEQLIRECFVAIAGPLDPSEVQAGWERFRAERLPLMLADARDIPNEGDSPDGTW